VTGVVVLIVVLVIASTAGAPTTVFVDATGREAARESGAPRREQVLTALRPLLGSGSLVGTEGPDLRTRR